MPVHAPVVLVLVVVECEDRRFPTPVIRLRLGLLRLLRRRAAPDVDLRRVVERQLALHPLPADVIPFLGEVVEDHVGGKTVAHSAGGHQVPPRVVSTERVRDQVVNGVRVVPAVHAHPAVLLVTPAEVTLVTCGLRHLVLLGQRDERIDDRVVSVNSQPPAPPQPMNHRPPQPSDGRRTVPAGTNVLDGTMVRWFRRLPQPPPPESTATQASVLVANKPTSGSAAPWRAKARVTAPISAPMSTRARRVSRSMRASRALTSSRATKAFTSTCWSSLLISTWSSA